MARITTYTVRCPQCLVAGITRQLGFDDELGMIACDAPEPHTFERMPDEPAPPREESSGFGPETQQEPATTREQDKSRFGELMGKRKEVPVEPEKPPVSEPEVSNPVPTRVMAISGEFRAGDVVYSVGLKDALALPNGEILLGVVIPETWAQAVVAEAEAQGMPPGEYFSRWLTSDDLRSTLVDALVHYWASAPAPV
jgi:hypothetical protein